jgi:hypothetical protein
MTVFEMLRRVVWYKFIDVSQVFTASIIRAISEAGDFKHL